MEGDKTNHEISLIFINSHFIITHIQFEKKNVMQHQTNSEKEL